MSLRSLALALFPVVLISANSAAQLAPEIGYLLPAGGRAGTTVDVTLGGYDWTPDMQLFVHDPRIRLELLGPPSKVLVPEPPYWFGSKARGPAWPLSREFPARLTIPADVPPGLVTWQVANANGASPPAQFFVSDCPTVRESRENPGDAQDLPSLPVAVAGQIRRIEEVDRFRFEVPRPGLVTLEVVSRRIGSPLHAIVRVQEAADARPVTLATAPIVCDAADTEGRDLVRTFPAAAGKKYVVSLHDLDFAGDRSYVYQLLLTTEPRILAAYPAAGRRGEKRPIEFVGIGLATGADRLESLVRDVTFPPTNDERFTARIETPSGSAPFTLLLSDDDERAPPANTAELTRDGLALGPLALDRPLAVTAAFESRFGVHRYLAECRKGDKWKVAAYAKSLGSPLDLAVRVVGPDGKELMAGDDQPGTTDAVALLTVPADGTYRIEVADHSGHSGTRDANYRLAFEPVREDFTATLPTQLSLPVGEKANLPLKIVRTGDFAGPVAVSLEGLPAGITVPPELSIAAKKNDLAIELSCAADAAATASLCTVVARGERNGAAFERTLGKVLIATILKPRFKITPEGLDDVRKVNRGSTYLFPLLIERLENYAGEITLEMTSKQQRHRQGLASDEFVVPADAARVEYPIFVPEWMETTKTSRMILNGVARVPDPRGNVRTLVNRMQLRLGILPEGALMKLSHTAGELTVAPGSELRVGVVLSRAAGLREAVQVGLAPADGPRGWLSASPIVLAPGQSSADLTIRLAADAPRNEHTIVLRAETKKDGWPVVAETSVLVTVGP